MRNQTAQRFSFAAFTAYWPHRVSRASLPRRTQQGNSLIHWFNIARYSDGVVVRLADYYRIDLKKIPRKYRSRPDKARNHSCACSRSAVRSRTLSSEPPNSPCRTENRTRPARASKGALLLQHHGGYCGTESQQPQNIPQSLKRGSLACEAAQEIAAEQSARCISERDSDTRHSWNRAEKVNEECGEGKSRPDFVSPQQD